MKVKNKLITVLGVGFILYSLYLHFYEGLALWGEATSPYHLWEPVPLTFIIGIGCIAYSYFEYYNDSYKVKKMLRRNKNLNNF